MCKTCLMNSYKISETKQTQHLAHSTVIQSTHKTLLKNTGNSALSVVLQLAHTELFNTGLAQQCISTIGMTTLSAHNIASAYYSQCATLLTTYTDCCSGKSPALHTLNILYCKLHCWSLQIALM